MLRFVWWLRCILFLKSNFFQKYFLIIFVLLFSFQCKTNKNEISKNEIPKIENQKGFPKSSGYVSDYDKVFTDSQIDELAKILADYDRKTTNQIAIVSITDTLNEDNFDQYALDLSTNWKVGTAEKNNGLTLILSDKLRKIRICTGTGTEKILTDEICEKVLNEQILPEFKKGDYFLGIKNGVNEFMRLWK